MITNSPRYHIDPQRAAAGPLLQALEAAGADVSRPSAIRCPFHEDNHPSAGVYESEGVWRFKCHGCGYLGDVIDVTAKAKGVTTADVLRELKATSKPASATDVARLNAKYAKGNAKTYTIAEAQQALLRSVQSSKGETYRLTAVWVYKWQGVEYARVLRFDGIDGKTFRPLRVVDGGYQIGDPQTWRPYRIDDVPADGWVYIVEGEKAADALWSIGVPAVTSAHGSKSASKTDWSSLKGRSVVIWPDHDEPGTGYASEVAALLTKVGVA